MRVAFLLTMISLLISACGCTPPVDPALSLMDLDLRITKVDDLSRTMGFIFSESRFDQKEFESNVSGGLNRWVTYSTDNVGSVEWQLDPIAEPLFKNFQGSAFADRTDELSFVDADAYFIQESAWVDQVVKRTSNSTHLGSIELYRLAADDYKPSETSTDPIAEVVHQLNPDLSGKSAVKLANAFKYFDWIVRNIQLMPETDHRKDDLDELRLNDSKDLAKAGIAGTGYQRYPWQTLIYGRGDYVDRAKLFMVGLQHLELDSMMLAVKTKDGQLQPWVVAVSIDNNLYLFDTKLALPLPGEKLGSIATLSQIQEKPKLIDGLDLRVDESLEDDTDYWVSGDQLSELVGLIYITPEGLSRRMKALENGLIGDERLLLTGHPSEVKKRLDAVGKVETQLWDNAFKTHQFRQAVREALNDTTNNQLVNRLQWHYDEEAYIDSFTRYRTSRARFFGGRFESERDYPGLNAIESFEKLNYTDQDIEDLATDSMLQERLGILKPSGSDEAQNAADFKQQLRNVQAQMRLIRRDTGFFLAQAHFDNGSFSAAANWLSRLSEKEDADRWSDGIEYLLGRAIESRKEYDLAMAQYRKFPKSTQAHGNLIRARLLLAVVKSVFGEVAP